MPDPKRLIAISLTAALLVLAGGCDSNTDDAPPTPAADKEPTVDRTTFTSQKAPYSVELPAGWTERPDKRLNRHADLAATLDGRLFLIIIPQKLPDLKGVDPPDAEALKSASLERMSQNVDGLQVERTGPVSLENGSGLSVFAEGRVDQERVQYIATFVTYDGWGYQIIAWGPASSETELIESVDRLIGGWQFGDNSVGSASQPANPADTSEQSADATD
jgi:hypothetical protein